MRSTMDYVANFYSPEAAMRAYTRFVSNVADNTVSTIRLSNNVIFSTLDAWKPVYNKQKIFQNTCQTWE